jgi:hypothetical protein
VSVVRGILFLLETQTHQCSAFSILDPMKCLGFRCASAEILGIRHGRSRNPAVPDAVRGFAAWRSAAAASDSRAARTGYHPPRSRVAKSSGPQGFWARRPTSGGVKHRSPSRICRVLAIHGFLSYWAVRRTALAMVGPSAWSIDAGSQEGSAPICRCDAKQPPSNRR